jgi:hypothetical protein
MSSQPIKHDLWPSRAATWVLLAACASGCALLSWSLAHRRAWSHHQQDRERVELARQRIDVNTASTASLCRLPEIGPALAAAIIQFRQQRSITSVHDLLQVRGIGEATTRAIEPYLFFPSSHPSMDAAVIDGSGN